MRRTSRFARLQLEFWLTKGQLRTALERAEETVAAALEERREAP
jgi:hypothetical protein